MARCAGCASDAGTAVNPKSFEVLADRLDGDRGRGPDASAGANARDDVHDVAGAGHWLLEHHVSSDHRS
jgi:hypothetical protein